MHAILRNAVAASSRNVQLSRVGVAAWPEASAQRPTGP
jgi:hypothetical protein